MSDTPTSPDDPNRTTRYEPPTTSGEISPPPASPPPPVAPPPAPPPTWTERTWRSRGDDPGRWGTIVFGGILVAIGLWFFADQTLGLDMPRLRWSDLWPILLIALGGWIVLGSMRRGS